MPKVSGNAVDAQRILLRVLLWMLALAACAGVLAVFMSTGIMGRVAGSALLAAVACGVASPVSRFLDADEKRRAGLVGLSASIVGFVLGLVAIWIDVTGIRGDFDSQLALTALVFVVGGLMACLLMLHALRPAGRIAAWTGIVMIASASACFLSATWFHFGRISTGETQDHLAITGGYLLLCGVPGCVCLIGTPARDRAWRWAGVLASAAALVIALAGTWFITSGDPTWLVAMLTVAIVAGHANGAVRVPLGEAGFWARLIAIGSMGATGACITALAYLTQFKQQGPDALTKAAGASAIVAVCSTIGLMILYRLNRRVPGVSANVAEIAAVTVVCPHCGTRRGAPIGASACGKCGLRITLVVKEPRCEKCDYSLLDIKEGVCPECGTRAVTA